MNLKLKPAGQKQSFSSHSGSSHFNNWPNDLAFETSFVRHEPIELKVTGDIPAYAAGTLYRTGPGVHTVKCDNGQQFEAQHWFDGLTVVHRFHIKAGESGPVEVTYNSRCTADKLIERIRRTGKFKDFSFAQKRDPCQSFFKKLMSVFSPESHLDADAQNIGVALTPDMPGICSPSTSDGSSPIRSITARTDAAKYQILDPETLEPIGACNQTSLHPSLKGPISGTHAKTDPVTGDVFNYNLEPGRRGTYRIWQAHAATGKTDVLATIEAPPAYLHSIFLTQNTVLLCVWNAHFAYRGAAIVYHRNVLDSIAPLDPNEPARWYVVDRSPARRGLLATYHSPAFFCFHTINAYEEASMTEEGEEKKVDIVADLIAYQDLSVLHRFYYDNLVSSSPQAVDFLKRQDGYRGTFTRYRLPNVPVSATTTTITTKTPSKSTTITTMPNRPSTTETLYSSFPHLPSSPSSSSPTCPRPALLALQASKSSTLELPTISPLHNTRPYRYHYGVSDSGLSTFFDGIGKHDSATGETLFWRREGQTPGEPIFVPSPKARARARAGEAGAGGGDGRASEVNGDKGRVKGIGEEEEEEEEGGAEDDGILLSVVLDGLEGESYLLVLDARTMQEVGRAEMVVSGEEGEAAGEEGGIADDSGEVRDVGGAEESEGRNKRKRKVEEDLGREERWGKEKMVIGMGFHGVHVPDAPGLACGGGE